jgi:ABC-2 type transport system permease protein
VNWQHISTFIWLRYRLRVNQLRRGGIANSILLGFITVFCFIAAIGLFVGGFFLGLFAFHTSPPVVRLIVWDGLIAAFLFGWMIGLMTELQRSDALSLDKFLHLPVSPVGAFLINYVSSLFSLSLIMFVPGMVGLILGEAFADGPQMLLALPLLAAFILAVTGLTNQFQGWLASMMTNPRRRRTVIVMVTMSFILIGQLPNLINVIRPWESKSVNDSVKYTDRMNELNKSFTSGQISQADHQRQTAEATKEYQENIRISGERDSAQLLRNARIISTALPPAWLALGSADLAEGTYVSGFLGGIGFALVGVFSLWRSYRTTLRIYTGHDQRGSRKPATPSAPKKTEKFDGLRLIEWRLPWVPDRVAAVAVGAFRSFLRAPEAKMVLILPFVMVLVFASVFMSIKTPPPIMVRPLLAFGVIVVVFMSAIQLVGNQFGYDRGGFRAYVLSPIPRRDILLGKNLAVAPFAFGLVSVGLIGLECLCPLRIDHFLAAFAQAAAMFMLFCLLANTVSILTPIPIAAGALQPKQVKLTPILAHLALVFLFPIIYAPLLIPLGIEALVSELTGIEIIPIALPLMVGMLIAAAFVYRWGMNLLGQFLTRREQRILEIVTSKTE